jgi:hypothetical protein
VLTHLQSLYGATVRISVEIEATHAEEFPAEAQEKVGPMAAERSAAVTIAKSRCVGERTNCECPMRLIRAYSLTRVRA